MQLIVLGMQNSGTTTVTRILNMMGVYYGPEGMRVSEMLRDPVGNWERKDLRELSENVLSAVDARWDKIADFDLQKLPKVAKDQFMKKVTNLVLELDVNKPWVINEPCMCLLFPLLRPLLETPICILVNRSPAHIAQELRDFHGFPIKFSMALWEKYTISALSASAGLPRIFVSFEEIVKNPVNAIEQLNKYLCECDVQGLRLPHEREIRDLVQKNLNNSEDPDRLDHSFFNICQKRLLETIEKKQFDQLDPHPSLSVEAIETLFQFEDKANFEEAYKKKCVEFTEQTEVLDAKERENRSFKSKIDEKDAIIQGNNRDLMDVQNALKDARNEVVHLKKEKGREVEELKKQGEKLRKDICEREESLKIMKNSLIQYELDLHEAKNELQSTHERMEMFSRDVDLLQTEIQKYKRIQREAETTIKSREKYLKTLESSLEHEKYSVYKLTRWLEKLGSDFKVFKQSKRWTIGHGVVRMLEMALMRKKVPIAMDHIGGILLQFGDWKSSGSKKKAGAQKKKPGLKISVP